MTVYVHGLMLLMVVLVASSFPVGQFISGTLPADTLMFIRFSLAALIFMPFVYLRFGLELPKLKRFAAYGLLSWPLVGFFWCMFTALEYTNALNTGALYTLVPALTAINSFILNRERTQPRVVLGLVVGTLGAAWIVVRGDLTALLALDFNYGDGVFFLGCICMGFYKPLIKKLYIDEPIMLMTFWVTLCGALWLFLISFTNLSLIEWQQVPVSTYAWVIYLAIFTTLVTFFLVQFGTVHLGVVNVAAYSFLTPVFVILIGLFIGGEAVSVALLPGVVMVVVAMWFVQVKRVKA